MQRWGGWGAAVACALGFIGAMRWVYLLTSIQQGSSHQSMLQVRKPRLRDLKCWLRMAELAPWLQSS